jgi:hypothetical protein
MHKKIESKMVFYEVFFLSNTYSKSIQIIESMDVTAILVLLLKS